MSSSSLDVEHKANFTSELAKLEEFKKKIAAATQPAQPTQAPPLLALQSAEQTPVVMNLIPE